jgi:hypothetical protein
MEWFAGELSVDESMVTRRVFACVKTGSVILGGTEAAHENAIFTADNFLSRYIQTTAIERRY